MTSLFAGMIFNEHDQELRDLGYQKHAFNLLISNRLGYHRDVPDTRSAAYVPGWGLLSRPRARCRSASLFRRLENLRQPTLIMLKSTGSEMVLTKF